MSNKSGVLNILERERGGFVSGSELGRELHMSRNCVWKAMNELREEGYIIDSVKGLGYRLSDGDAALTAPGIEKHAGDGFFATVYSETDSTNTRLKLLAEAGAPEWTVVAASKQTAGRGRLGRSFFSPEATGLYMSVLVRPRLRAEDALLMTTAAAVATARAIEAEFGVSAGIKWVNDILVDGRKVCGILTEAALDVESGRLRYAVVGIGVNISEPEGGFPPDIAAVAGSLCGRAPVNAESRNRLAGRILAEFAALYRALPARGFMEEYAARSVVVGREVDILASGGRRRALAVSIDGDAHLIVRFPDGSEETLSSGEVSVRL